MGAAGAFELQRRLGSSGREQRFEVQVVGEISMSRYQVRRDKFRRNFKKEGADCFLVTNFTNVTYLSGFTGDDSFLLFLPDRELVLSDPRYTTQLQQECPDLDLEIRSPGTAMFKLIQKVFRAVKPRGIGFESGSMSVHMHGHLCEEVPGVEWVPCNGLIEILRMVKDREEVQAIRGAVAMAQRAFAVARAGLRGAETERAVAHGLENQIRLFGGRGCSFPPIVATGPRAALPHATPESIPIESHGLLLIDWGADGPEGYKSDLTRVLVTGKISPKLERVYRLVLKAQERAIRAIRPGVLCSAVDAAARKVIAAAGFGKYFGHGLGHGIGLDIHEGPRLAGGSDRPLRAGMVVTVEPGVYLPGVGGVRIEDDVLVTRDGHTVLSDVPKEWDDVHAELG